MTAIEPDLVFLVGTGRCGSTLLHEVVARHPEIGFVSNVDDRLRRGAGRWNRAIYRHVPDALTTKGRVRFAPSEAYEVLASQVSPLLAEPFRDLRADDLTPWLERRLRRFFVERAEAQSADTFLHKLTGWPRVGLLAAAFPEARFIHVVRDGRAVVNSWLQMPWWRGHRGPSEWHFGPLTAADEAEWEASNRSFAVLAALGWRLLMAAYDDAAGLLDADRWLEIRHEDVCAAPREVIGAVLGFAELEWTDDFERGFQRHTFRVDDPGRVAAELGADAHQRIEHTLAAVLARHGYEVLNPS